MLTRRNGIIASIAGLLGCKPSPRESISPQVGAAQQAGVSIYTEEFRLVLPGDWREVQSSDPNQISCESVDLKSSIVASVIFAALPRDKLVEAAERLATSRQAAERAARPNVVFAETYVGFRETDQAGHVAYGGHDDSSYFRFFGWATERKIMSFWISTETTDAAVAERVAREVMGQGFAMIFP